MGGNQSKAEQVVQTVMNSTIELVMHYSNKCVADQSSSQTQDISGFLSIIGFNSVGSTMENVVKCQQINKNRADLKNQVLQQVKAQIQQLNSTLKLGIENDDEMKQVVHACSNLATRTMETFLNSCATMQAIRQKQTIRGFLAIEVFNSLYAAAKSSAECVQKNDSVIDAANRAKQKIDGNATQKNLDPFTSAILALEDFLKSLGTLGLVFLIVVVGGFFYFGGETSKELLKPGTLKWLFLGIGGLFILYEGYNYVTRSDDDKQKKHHAEGLYHRGIGIGSHPAFHGVKHHDLHNARGAKQGPTANFELHNYGAYAGYPQDSLFLAL